MDWDHRPHQALDAAIARLLRPLFRLLLRHGVSFGAFEDLAKRIYVDVALQGLRHAGQEAVDLARIDPVGADAQGSATPAVRCRAHDGSEAGERYNRAARVLTGWVRDADFLDAAASRGRSARRRTGLRGARQALQRRHAGARRARRTAARGRGAAREDGRIELLTRAYVPTTQRRREAAHPRHRCRRPDRHHRPQPAARRSRPALPAQGHVPRACRSKPLPAFRKLSAAQAQALLEKLDRWLAAHDIDNPPESRGRAARARRPGHLLLRGTPRAINTVRKELRHEASRLHGGDGAAALRLVHCCLWRWRWRRRHRRHRQPRGHACTCR